jgi:hypothetical protein
MSPLDFSRVPLPPLWTLEQAKVHLKITGTDSDADIQQKLDTAQEAVLSYLGPFADATWTAETAPKPVTHAIQLLTAFYFDDRGDGQTPDAWPKVYALLAAYRDPTVSA